MARHGFTVVFDIGKTTDFAPLRQRLAARLGMSAFGALLDVRHLLAGSRVLSRTDLMLRVREPMAMQP